MVRNNIRQESFEVYVPIVGYVSYEVKAKSLADAKKIVLNGGGENPCKFWEESRDLKTFDATLSDPYYDNTYSRYEGF